MEEQREASTSEPSLHPLVPNYVQKNDSRRASMGIAAEERLETQNDKNGPIFAD